MEIDVGAISHSNQDYLKAILTLSEWSDTPVTAKALSQQVGVSLSSTSDAVRRLFKMGLVHHTPYGAIELTDSGRQYAVAMVRRHRLIESFLTEALGYSWDQVHTEAENLEHAVSDFLISRIDSYLGFPTHDPHGDPIPAADGTFPHRPHAEELMPLAELQPEQSGIVERIRDSDPELLHYFTTHGLRIGSTVAVLSAGPYSDAHRVSVEGTDTELVLGNSALSAVLVRRASKNH